MQRNIGSVARLNTKMPFPPAPRVLYRKAPLERVICQLRYPPILKIGAEPPTAFQDRIRRQYPFYQRQEPEVVGPGATSVPPELAEMIRRLAGPAIPLDAANHRFATADERRFLNLTPEFLALTETAYTRWERFSEHLVNAERLLREIYEPAFYTRTGLRYRDVIRPRELGLDGVPWRELLSPGLLGELADTNTADHVEDRQVRVIIMLVSARGKVQLRHGLRIQDGEQQYAIDADFYTDERLIPEDAHATVSDFNKLARRLFRWAVTDKLRDAMEPEYLAERT